MEYWFACNYHRIISIKTIIICSLLLGNLPARNVQKHREGSPLELQFLQPNYYLPLSWHRSSAQCKFSQSHYFGLFGGIAIELLILALFTELGLFQYEIILVI